VRKFSPIECLLDRRLKVFGRDRHRETACQSCRELRHAENLKTAFVGACRGKAAHLKGK
jgi:hypothetical protein